MPWYIGPIELQSARQVLLSSVVLLPSGLRLWFKVWEWGEFSKYPHAFVTNWGSEFSPGAVGCGSGSAIWCWKRLLISTAALSSCRFITAWWYQMIAPHCRNNRLLPLLASYPNLTSHSSRRDISMSPFARTCPPQTTFFWKAALLLEWKMNMQGKFHCICATAA